MVNVSRMEATETVVDDFDTMTFDVARSVFERPSHIPTRERVAPFPSILQSRLHRFREEEVSYRRLGLDVE